jgi:hypothetical protein
MDNNTSAPFDVSGFTSGSKKGSRRYGFWLMCFTFHMAVLRFAFGSVALFSNLTLISLLGLHRSAQPLPFLVACEFYFNAIACTFLWGFGWLVRTRYWQRGQEFPQLAHKYVGLVMANLLINGVFACVQFVFESEVRSYILEHWNYALVPALWFFIHLGLLAGWRRNLARLMESGRGSRVFHRNLAVD